MVTRMRMRMGEGGWWSGHDIVDYVMNASSQSIVDTRIVQWK